jgi:hypothetical protein
MLRQIGIVAALLLPTSAALVFAGDYPRVIYPIGHTLPADAQGSVKVQVPLLRPSSEPSGSQDLLIQGGAITAIDLLTNDVAVLPPGSYRVSSITVSAPSGISPQQALAESNPISSEVDVMSPSFRLSDAILTQQQKYLDSLKIDVKDINKMLASIIRGLVPRRP